MPPRRARAAGLVFALLVLATVAAFAWSQRLKRDPLVLDRVTFGKVVHGKTVRAFTPNGDCRFDRERIRFRVTRSDHAVVQVIEPGGHLVITLARGAYLKRYHFFTYYWDGRTRNTPADGPKSGNIGRFSARRRGVAPPGRYKLRVKLLGQGRTLVPPGVIGLHRAPRNPAASCKRVARGAP